MKKLVICLTIMVISAVTFAALVENVISFQGRIVEGGVPVNGARNIEFKLYNFEAGGTALWTEDHFVWSIVDGLFSVELGGVNTFASAGVDFNEQYWIGLSVESAPEITPRYKLTSSPYTITDGDWAYNSGSGLTGDIYHTGYIAIGLSNPAYLLDVGKETVAAWMQVQSGTNSAGLIIRRGDAADNGLIHYKTGSTNNWYAGMMGDNGWGISETSTGDGTFYITPSNDIGIGTTIPTAKTHAVDGNMKGYFCKVTTPVDGTSYNSVYGEYSTDAVNGALGVYNDTGGGYYYGVIGNAFNSTGRKYGLHGYASGTGTHNFGVYGCASLEATNCFAGFFNGTVHVSGALSKSSGSFLIDHPLDPENKTLRHNFVESPWNMCVYPGKVTLDGSGEATVEMPEYYSALVREKDAIAQITPIGRPFPVGYEFEDGGTTLRIYGDPDRVVSYTVMADRDDPVMRRLYKPVEEEKGNGNFEKGKLLDPEAYGYPAEMGVDYFNTQIH